MSLHKAIKKKKFINKKPSVENYSNPLKLKKYCSALF